MLADICGECGATDKENRDGIISRDNLLNSLRVPFFPNHFASASKITTKIFREISRSVTSRDKRAHTISRSLSLTETEFFHACGRACVYAFRTRTRRDASCRMCCTLLKPYKNGIARRRKKTGKTVGRKRRVIEMTRTRERERKEEKESERGTGRFTQTLVKLRPSLTSGYIARVNELAPADDQGL